MSTPTLPLLGTGIIWGQSLLMIISIGRAMFYELGLLIDIFTCLLLGQGEIICPQWCPYFIGTLTLKVCLCCHQVAMEGEWLLI